MQNVSIDPGTVEVLSILILLSTDCISAVGVHLVVIFQVVAGSHVLKPLGIIKIPLHCFLNALGKLQGRFPAELVVEFGSVDGVAEVVSFAIGDVGDEMLGCTFGIAEQTINSLDHQTDEIDVLPLIEAADIICVASRTFVEDKIDRTRMIFYKQPVTHVLTLAVDRKWFSMADIVDKERDKLLRELIWSVVVGAVGHDRRQLICVMVCSHEMVARCLGCRIGRVGIVFGFFRKECAVKFQRTIDLVGGNVVEEFSVEPAFGFLPDDFRGLKQ